MPKLDDFSHKKACPSTEQMTTEGMSKREREDAGREGGKRRTMHARRRRNRIPSHSYEHGG